jgi:mRNA interferase HigB
MGMNNYFWKRQPDARQSLQAWYTDAKQADWKTPSDIKDHYRNASILSDNRVMFNIKGNKFRLVVAINYKIGIIYIRFVGTHREYDKIDSSAI